MTGRIVRSVGPFVVGAALLLSGACTGPSAAGPATTPPLVSSAAPVTSSSAVTSSASSSAPASTTATASPSSPVPSSSTSSSMSSTATASTVTVDPDQRFAWRVDSTVPKTKDVQAAITAAIPMYRGFMATYDESLRAPQARNWETVMKAYASDTALTDWKAAWQSSVKYGTLRTGTTSSAARVTAASASGLNMRVCMDFTKLRTVDKTGKPVPIQKGIPEKGLAWLLTIENNKVVALLAQTPSGKTFVC